MKERKRLTLNLSLRIALYVMAFNVIILLFFGWFRYQNQANRFRNDLEENLQRTVVFLADNLAVSVYEFNEPNIRSICRAAFSQPDVQAIRLDSLDFPMEETHFVQGPDRQLQPWTADRDYMESGLTWRREEIRFNGERLGWVSVGINPDFMLSSLRERLFETIQEILALAVILTILMFLVLRFLLVAPLSRLAQVTYKIERAEQALVAQEARQSAIISNISEVLAILDRDGTITYKSPNILNFYGWEPEMLIGRSAWDNIHPEDREQALAEFHSVLSKKNRRSTFELRYKHADGRYTHTVFTATNLLHHPNILGVLLNYHDISERKKAQMELRESEERFKALHNASFGGITIHEKGMILDCNRGLSQISGFTYEELIGMDGLLLIAEEYRDLVRNKIAQGYERPYEAYGCRKNGEVYPLRLEARNIPYRGKTVRVVEFRDITEQKAAEEEVQRKNEEYMTVNNELSDSLYRIQKINMELEEAKERAEESDRLKTTFLANLSHEIRTPMNGILGFADLLGADDLTPDTQKKYIDLIKQSGDRMLHLISDLVDISRIETGQIVLNPGPCSRTIDEQTSRFLRTPGREKGLTFDLEKGIPDPGPTFHVDQYRLEQVLTNLVGNALKFTRRGGVEMGYESMGQDLRFHVKDSGPGIAAAFHEKIFERFRQVEDTPLRAEEGSGLGLAISKSIVELMGGTIGVQSEPGKGSTFFFQIPFLPAEKTRDGAVPETSTPNRTGRESILVAEDDELSFIYLQETLENDFTSVLWAQNGKEAIDLLEMHPEVSLILMDLKMPVLNGLDAVREIRKKNRDIPIIAQTAYAHEAELQKALDAGCNDTLTKPISKVLLKQKVTKYLLRA
ncbi:MAG: PAS domain S-box protein [Bacteroidales bacterium]